MTPSTPEIVFAGTNGGALTEIADYVAVGGFAAVAKARALTPDEVIAELNASNLRGRGGAFFPTGRKWSFVPKPDKIPKPHYLVINADESEPGTFKDREIMLRVPFRFLEGCLIAAHAIAALMGNVRTHAVRMLPATPQRTALTRLLAPTPMMHALITCVVEIIASV